MRKSRSYESTYPFICHAPAPDLRPRQAPIHSRSFDNQPECQAGDAARCRVRGFERNGQFRYTPPTHCLLALEQALMELAAEGGVAARHDRYRRNHEVLLDGMRGMGFRSFLPAEVQSPFITSFHYPLDPRFFFETFYHALSDSGYIIYPGKISQADLFRIGSIGRLFPSDMRALLAAVRDVCAELGIDLRPTDGQSVELKVLGSPPGVTNS